MIYRSTDQARCIFKTEMLLQQYTYNYQDYDLDSSKMVSIFHNLENYTSQTKSDQTESLPVKIMIAPFDFCSALSSLESAYESVEPDLKRFRDKSWAIYEQVCGDRHAELDNLNCKGSNKKFLANFTNATCWKDVKVAFERLKMEKERSNDSYPFFERMDDKERPPRSPEEESRAEERIEAEIDTKMRLSKLFKEIISAVMRQLQVDFGVVSRAAAKIKHVLDNKRRMAFVVMLLEEYQRTGTQEVDGIVQQVKNLGTSTFLQIADKE